MATVTIPSGGSTASYIVSEARSPYRSREVGRIAAGAGVLPNGMILGRRTATGDYAPYTPGAGDGTGTAAAILFEDVDATSAPVRVTLTVRDTEVQRAALKFSGTPTTAQQDAAFASLAAAGIVLR